MMDTSNPNFISQIDLVVGEDDFTKHVLKYLGTKAVFKYDDEGYVFCDFPDSTYDLLIHDDEDGTWMPVVAAFTENLHLYLVAESDDEFYIFSPTSSESWVRFTSNFDFTLEPTDEFYVNFLKEENIAKVEPL